MRAKYALWVGGDHSAIAADPNVGVVALWTDLRNITAFAGHPDLGKDVFFVRSR